MNKIDLFKDVMPSIMHHKNQIFQSDNEIDSFYDNNSYIINRVLSMYNDCVLPANLMNMNYHLDGKLKHDFYYHLLRGYKRRYNYAKQQKYDDLSMIKEYYNVSNTKAKEYSALLTSDQKDYIKKLLDKGGVK